MDLWMEPQRAAWGELKVGAVRGAVQWLLWAGGGRYWAAGPRGHSSRLFASHRRNPTLILSPIPSSSFIPFPHLQLGQNSPLLVNVGFVQPRRLFVVPYRVPRSLFNTRPPLPSIFLSTPDLPGLGGDRVIAQQQIRPGLLGCLAVAWIDWPSRSKRLTLGPTSLAIPPHSVFST